MPSISASRSLLVARLEIANSSALASRPAALTSLVGTPLLTALLMLAIASTQEVDVGRTLLASALVSQFVVTTGLIAESLFRDRRVGVLRDIASYGLLSRPAYWVGKAMVAAFLGWVSFAVLSTVAVAATDSVHRIPSLWAISAVAGMSAAAAGCAVGLLSLWFADPFLISNLFGAGLFVTAGVVVPLSDYPEWASYVVRLLPATNAVQALQTGQGTALLVEVAVCLTWAAAALASTSRIVSSLRSGRTDVLM